MGRRWPRPATDAKPAGGLLMTDGLKARPRAPHGEGAAAEPRPGQRDLCGASRCRRERDGPPAPARTLRTAPPAAPARAAGPGRSVSQPPRPTAARPSTGFCS